MSILNKIKKLFSSLNINIALFSTQVIGDDNQVLPNSQHKTNQVKLKDWQKMTLNAAFGTLFILAVFDILAICDILNSSSARTNELQAVVLLTITIVLNLFTLKYRLNDASYYSMTGSFTLWTTLALYICESRTLFIFTLSAITSIGFLAIFYWLTETYIHPKVRLYKLTKQRS